MSALATRESPADQWAWWRSALAGTRLDFDKNDPPSGYYRNHDRSMAVWREDDGSLHWAMSSGFHPRHLDQMLDTFATFCMRPITYDDWAAHQRTGRWSEDPTAEIEAARHIPSADGAVTRHDNNPPVEAIIADEIDTTKRAFSTWLKEIGGAITTEEHDAKAVKFQERFQSLAKRADEAFEAEKAEIRKIGQAIDAKWRGPKADAKAGKDLVGTAALDYREARKARQDEEARKAKEDIDWQRAEQAKRKAEAEAANRPVPVETPIIAPPVRKQATGLRSVPVVVISDLAAVAAQFAAMSTPPAEFVESIRTVALRMLKARAEVKGATLTTEYRA